MSVEVDEFKMGGETFCKVDLYREGAQELIRRLVPAYLLEAAEDADLKVKFNDLLPVLHHSQLSKAPCAISFAMLCRIRLRNSAWSPNKISLLYFGHQTM